MMSQSFRRGRYDVVDKGARLTILQLLLLLGAGTGSIGTPATALGQAGPPPPVKIEAALACKLKASEYNGFAQALEDEEGGYKAWGWIKQVSSSPFLDQYRLPSSITVAGHVTSTIVFSGSGVAAVLDEPGTASLSRTLGAASPPDRDPPSPASRSTAGSSESAPFKAETVIQDTSERDPRLGTIHTRIVRVVENNAALPGKTLVGCTYSIAVDDH